MATFTDPIKYANQDFDEYQSAVTRVGAPHADWFAQQRDGVRHALVHAAWLANQLDLQNAYHAIERWHGLRIT